MWFPGFRICKQFEQVLLTYFEPQDHRTKAEEERYENATKDRVVRSLSTTQRAVIGWIAFLVLNLQWDEIILINFKPVTISRLKFI